MDLHVVDGGHARRGGVWGVRKGVGAGGGSPGHQRGRGRRGGGLGHVEAAPGASGHAGSGLEHRLARLDGPPPAQLRAHAAGGPSAGRPHHAGPRRLRRGSGDPELPLPARNAPERNGGGCRSGPGHRRPTGGRGRLVRGRRDRTIWVEFRGVVPVLRVGPVVDRSPPGGHPPAVSRRGTSTRRGGSGEVGRPAGCVAPGSTHHPASAPLADLVLVGGAGAVLAWGEGASGWLVARGSTTCSSIWFTSAPFAAASVGIPFSFSITASGGAVTKITRKGRTTQGWEDRLTGNGAAALLGTPVSPRTKSATSSWSLNLKATSGRGAAKQVATQALVLTVNLRGLPAVDADTPPTLLGSGTTRCRWLPTDRAATQPRRVHCAKECSRCVK